MTDTQINPILGWCVVELLGHNILYGIVSEEQHFGSTLGRCEVPTGEDTWQTKWFGGGAVFRITPTDEETCRRLAGYRRPQISRYASASEVHQVGSALPPDDEDPDPYDGNDEEDNDASF